MQIKMEWMLAAGVGLTQAVMATPALAHVAEHHDLGVLGFFHMFTSIEHLMAVLPAVAVLVVAYLMKNKTRNKDNSGIKLTR